MVRCRAIYVAGPMRGFPDLNFPAFHAAADRLRRAGWIVRNPVEIGREAFGPSPDACRVEDFLREDVRALLDCDAIALLSGWQASTGARAEAALALALGLDFYDAETLEEVEPPDGVLVSSYRVASASPTGE